MPKMDMREQAFGIEIELTGLTREKAAKVLAAYFHTDYQYEGGCYQTYSVTDGQDRKWKLTRDSSIRPELKNGTRMGDGYKVELVSPICEYADIEKIQEIARQLRHNGAVANSSCGIHIHINAAPHTARSLRNITNIMASKEDLIYKALKVDVAREYSYCKKIEMGFLEEMNRKKPKTLQENYTDTVSQMLSSCSPDIRTGTKI